MQRGKSRGIELVALSASAFYYFDDDDDHKTERERENWVSWSWERWWDDEIPAPGFISNTTWKCHSSFNKTTPMPLGSNFLFFL